MQLSINICKGEANTIRKTKQAITLIFATQLHDI